MYERLDGEDKMGHFKYFRNQRKRKIWEGSVIKIQAKIRQPKKEVGKGKDKGKYMEYGFKSLGLFFTENYSLLEKIHIITFTIIYEIYL